MAVDAGDKGRIARVFERQWLHLGGLVVLLLACQWAAQAGAVRRGELWGLAALAWYWLAILTAVAHQVYVWLCWRVELHGGLLTRRLGGVAFPAFAAGFALIGIPRLATVFVLAYADRGSLPLPPLPLQAAAVVALVPALYLFYSVKRYFTFRRAFGADHFDPSVRGLPFIRKGIFRLTANGMYVFGFLLFWVPGLWWASAAGLVAAAFNHLYIWLHYYATERPDIERMYGRGEKK